MITMASQRPRIRADVRDSVGAFSWLFRLCHTCNLAAFGCRVQVTGTAFATVFFYQLQDMKQGKNQLHDNFSSQLRARMKACQIGQVALAEAVGVAQSAVSGWLNGAFPGSAELYRLSKVLGVEMQWFFEVIPHIPIPEAKVAKMKPHEIPASAIAPEQRAHTALVMKAASMPELIESLRDLEAEIAHRKQLTEAETLESIGSVKRTWENLLVELRRATEPSGKVSELAKFLSEKTGRKVPLASVSRWLADTRKPGAKITMLMLQWVERERVK